MAKRHAVKELTHDNWDVEEEEEDPGTFVPLKKSELQNRVIKKAKRSLSKDAPAMSPFAAFSGFTPSKPKSLPVNVSSKSSAVPLATELKKMDEEQNGNSESSEKKDETTNIALKKQFRSTTPTETIKTRSIDYYRQLQSLNESVLKWMQLHLTKNPCCDFTPVFTDYKKHLDTLNVTYPITKKIVSSAPTSSVVKDNTDNFSFKRPATTVGGGCSSKISNSCPGENSSGTFKFNTSSLEKEETDYGAHFASNTTNTSTVSFGIHLTPTETSSITPKGPTTTCSEEEECKKEQKSPMFSFGLKKTESQGKSQTPNENKTFSFGFSPVKKTAENETFEDTEYIPPKNDFTAVSETDAFYSKKCKLFFKKDDNFVEKGVGMLYLKPIEEKAQLLIRADTNLGNILLNIMLSASLPMSRTGKNNVLIVCVPNPPIDGKNVDSNQAIPILIRVKTAADADELLEFLNKHAS